MTTKEYDNLRFDAIYDQFLANTDNDFCKLTKQFDSKSLDDFLYKTAKFFYDYNPNQGEDFLD